MDIIYLFVRKWKCQRAFRVLTFRVIGMVAFDGYIFLKLFDEYIWWLSPLCIKCCIKL